MSFLYTYRPTAALIAAMLALAAGLAFTSASSAATVSGSSKGLTATMTVGTHHPTVGRNWPLHITAKRSGRAARATVTYEYLFGGKVVAVRARHTFTGHFSDALVFPATAVHEPLTFRAVVIAGSSTVNLDYSIEVIQ